MKYSRKPLDEFLIPYRHEQGLPRILGSDISFSLVDEDPALRVYTLDEDNSLLVELDIDLCVKAVIVVSKPVTGEESTTLEKMKKLEEILRVTTCQFTGFTRTQADAVHHTLGLFKVNKSTFFNAKVELGELEFMKVLNSGTISYSINESDKLHKRINRENKIKRVFMN